MIKTAKKCISHLLPSLTGRGWGWVIFLATSCTQIDCPVQNTVYTVYNLKKADGTADTLKVDTLWIKTVRSDGTDTTLINRLCGTSAYTFDLPISYTQPEDVLFIEIADTMGGLWRDTIRIKKDNLPHFESVDCQASYFHLITAVSTSHHAIDSIVINNPNVTYDASTEHFHLYLKSLD